MSNVHLNSNAVLVTMAVVLSIASGQTFKQHNAHVPKVPPQLLGVLTYDSSLPGNVLAVVIVVTFVITFLKVALL